MCLSYSWEVAFRIQNGSLARGTAPVVVTEVANGLVENCTANKVPCGGALIFLFHFKKLSDFESMIERYARNNERMITVAVGHNGELPANVKKNPLCI